MVACDISINNVLAVVNSQLVAEYVTLEERVRTLGLCLKSWASARGINDRSRGTLSSFALILMLIHFLQRRADPPVLPSLQDVAFGRGEPAVHVGGIDCRYCTDREEISKELEYLGAGKPANRDHVGFLLLQFFRYFGHDYRHGVIRIRNTAPLLPPAAETGQYLVVDNPFEPGKDVANVDASQHSVLKKEFRRGWSLLSQGSPLGELLRSPGPRC